MVCIINVKCIINIYRLLLPNVIRDSAYIRLPDTYCSNLSKPLGGEACRFPR
jgi:hypothetical protein